MAFKKAHYDKKTKRKRSTTLSRVTNYTTAYNMQTVKFHKIPSETKIGKTYTVREMADGSFLCSCPRGVFGKKGFECKHIGDIRARLGICACSRAGMPNPHMTSHSKYDCHNADLGLMKA